MGTDSSFTVLRIGSQLIFKFHWEEIIEDISVAENWVTNLRETAIPAQIACRLNC